jgi:hypothetical protein
MGPTMSDAIVENYLRRLQAAASSLPADRRAELVEEISDHIAEARAGGQVPDEASLRTLLDRIGDPDEIVAEARDGEPEWRMGPPGPAMTGQGPPEPTYRRPGVALEAAALALMTFGSLLLVVGWLAGIAMLWSSRRWRVGEKLVATLVFPGGPFLAVFLLTRFATQVCSSSPVSDSTGATVQGPTVCTGFAFPPAVGIPLLFLWLVAPFVVAGVLLKRAVDRASAEPPVPVPARPAVPPGGSRWGGLEIAAVLLLSVGGFLVPIIGPVAGLICAWASDAWTTSEKWVATAIASCMLIVPLLGILSATVLG